MSRIRRHVVWLIAAGCCAAILALLWVTPSPDRYGRISEPQVWRISDPRCERLPVSRVVVDGISTSVCPDRPKEPPLPMLRVDFYLDGRPATIWVWDSPVSGGP
jgi:hypothetical protein